ncbi:MAG: AbrB/MazE/SpoVT family DNA-binding domain-containing protein [Sporichthyaceae bacterium]
MADTSHIMTISRNGQVSIPASARARWGTRKVLVVDMGDLVVMRPVSDDPIGEMAGKYAGRGLSSEEMRREQREDDEAEEDRWEEERRRAAELRAGNKESSA